MSHVTTIRCDECSKLRVNDTNHWLISTYAPRGWLVISSISDQQSMAEHWNTKMVHLCGQECAMKWVGRKIGEL